MKFKTIVISLIILFSILNITSLALIFSMEEIPTIRNTDCSNKTLTETSECFRDILKEHYYYNRSNIGKDLTEEQLYKEGGVCKHYALWYKEQFLKIGSKETEEILYRSKINYPFYVKTESFSLNNDTAHMVAIVSNNDGYCILDQLNINCFKVGP